MCKYKSLMHAGNSKEFAYSPIPQLAQKRCHIHTIDAYVQLVNMSIQLPCQQSLFHFFCCCHTHTGFGCLQASAVWLLFGFPYLPFAVGEMFVIVFIANADAKNIYLHIRIHFYKYIHVYLYVYMCTFVSTRFNNHQCCICISFWRPTSTFFRLCLLPFCATIQTMMNCSIRTCLFTFYK